MFGFSWGGEVDEGVVNGVVGVRVFGDRNGFIRVRYVSN